MSKGLEEIRQYKQVTCQHCQYHYGGECNNKDKCFSMIIEKELKRLAKIDDLLEEIGIDENDLPIWLEMQKQDGKKVKALEIIKNVGILKLYETSGGQCWLETMCDATKITKDNYDLLKEVGL